MPHRPSRRELICSAALDLAADGGNHAVTHTAIDARLSLAKGSTSYYFRTRAALVGAAISHLTETSRTAFIDRLDGVETELTIDSTATLIADYLSDLLTTRRRDLLARYAFAPDAASDEQHRLALAHCLFSPDAATSLLTALGAADPPARAADLLTLLEGIAFDYTYGPRSLADGDRSTDELAALIRRWLIALLTPPGPAGPTRR